jgi:hypothetical protein
MVDLKFADLRDAPEYCRYTTIGANNPKSLHGKRGGSRKKASLGFKGGLFFDC